MQEVHQVHPVAKSLAHGTRDTRLGNEDIPGCPKDMTCASVPVRTLSAAVNVVMNATTKSAAPLLCTESQSNMVKNRYGAGFVDTSTPNLKSA
jgi:hypothetical protein